MREIWRQDEIRILREFYADWPTEALARFLRRSVRKVYTAASRYGLKKSPEYIARELAKLGGALTAAGVGSRFRKGQVPPNKGLRRPGYCRGRMGETQFKKGGRPLNHLPIGTIQANADGYLRMKVRDDPQSIAGVGANSTNWMFVHRMVWEQAHGPIPEGHRIWWKDRDHNNCALENLELLSDVEHMRRTTLHNLPRPIVDAYYAIGRLNRKIRSIENGKKQNVGPARPSVRDA